MGFFTGNRKREQRLAEAGVDGQATLVSFTEVGQQNFTPLVDLSLRITPADGNAAFNVTVRTQVEFSEIGKLEPGDVFAVRYDPADHNNFQLQGKIASAGTATPGSPEQYSASELAAASQASGETGQKKSAAALLATGQRMTGVLREFAPSGHTVGDIDPSLPDPNDPVYVIKAELPISGSTPIETVFMNRVPQAKVATLQLGARVTLAVNPGNPTHEATIDWENSPVIGG